MTTSNGTVRTGAVHVEQIPVIWAVPEHATREPRLVIGLAPGPAAMETVLPDLERLAVVAAVADAMAGRETLLNARDDGVPGLVRAALAHVRFDDVPPLPRRQRSCRTTPHHLALVELGVAREFTGRRRYRWFVHERFVASLGVGTEVATDR